MCQLLETIQLLDGELLNIAYHNRRFNAARKELSGKLSPTDLAGLIQIPGHCITGRFRCRILYNEADFKVEFIPYEYRKIRRLKLIYDNTIDYHLKYADRSHLDALFSRRGDCDDIIIVKNGCLTDSYVANLVFYDGKDWCTPDTPLLQGTQRASLLDKGVISEKRITIENYRGFKKAGLINAFNDLTNMPVISVQEIYP
jgi:4-amino-4-deoxychorismate lyase